MALEQSEREIWEILCTSICTHDLDPDSFHDLLLHCNKGLAMLQLVSCLHFVCALRPWRLCISGLAPCRLFALSSSPRYEPLDTSSDAEGLLDEVLRAFL